MDATSMMWTSMLERRTKKHHGSAPLRTPRLRRRALNAYDLESVPASRHTADATENDSYEKAFKPKRSPGFVYVKHLAVFAFCLLLLISVTQQYNSLVRRSLRFAVAVSRRDPRSRHSPGSIRLPIPLPGADAGFELPPRSIPSPPTPFDDLVLDNPSGLGSARRIHEQDVDWYEEKREELLEAMDYKPDGLDETYLDNEDFYGPQQTCQRTNWRARWYHNCNTFHEQSLTRQHDGNLQSFDVTFRGSGSFRYSWLFRQGDEQEQMILKAVRWYNPFDYKYFAGMNNEALVMERLTGSPRIVDIYGHCGLSIMAENMVEEVTKDIVPGSEINWARYGYMKQEKLDALQQFDVHPINNLTNEEKLNLAIVMAESIADIHGYSGGVIVHGDIHPVQWLKNAKGQIKLNDFNNGVILNFDSSKNEYCEEWRCYGGTFRPPEELSCDDTYSDEKLDVWPMANNLYCLLTGLWPYYQYGNNQEARVIRHITRDCEMPYVDDRYRNRSLIEAGLVRIMEMAWECDHQKRMDIFHMVQELYELRESYLNSKGSQR